MRTERGRGLVSKAVREALCTFVSPPLCEQLIDRSLQSQGLTAIPESGVIIGEWVEGALRDQVEAAVGPDAADLLMMQLGPIAAHAAISQKMEPEDPAWPLPDRTHAGTAQSFGPEPQTNPRQVALETGDYDLQSLMTEPLVRTDSGAEISVSDRPTQCPAATEQSARSPKAPTPEPGLSSALPAGAPRILAATRSREIADGLRQQLKGRARVEHVADLVGLLDALEDGRGRRAPVLLVDYQNASVHVSSLMAIGEDLPRGTIIALWNADDQTWHDVDRERTAVCRWVRCARGATLSDVASMCAMLDTEGG